MQTVTRFLLASLLALGLSPPAAAQNPITAVQPVVQTRLLTSTVCPATAGTPGPGGTVSGTLSGPGCLVIDLGGYAAVGVQIRDDMAGSWAMNFEVTDDPSGTPTWSTIALSSAQTGALSTNVGSASVWQGTVVGRLFRVRATSLVSGTPIVMIRATAGVGSLGAGAGGVSPSVTNTFTATQNFSAIQLTSFVFANLATSLTANGQIGYCSDCNIANPCTGVGTGAIAKRLNGIYVCN